MPSSAVVRDAREMLERVNLLEVGCYELHGVRGVVGDDGRRQIIGPGPAADLEAQHESHELEVFWLESGGRLLVRLSVDLGTNVGEIRVGFQAEWDVADLTRDTVPPEVEEEFVNRVAVMALIPYVRAGISDVATRVLGGNVTMGLIRPGDLEFSSVRAAHEHEEPWERREAVPK